MNKHLVLLQLAQHEKNVSNLPHNIQGSQPAKLCLDTWRKGQHLPSSNSSGAREHYCPYLETYPKS